jgi:hypothetical protein
LYGYRSKRIEAYWKQFRFDEADTEPLHSVFAISPLITTEARRISDFVDMNIKIHLPVIDRIIALVAKSIVAVDSNEDAPQAEISR